MPSSETFGYLTIATSTDHEGIFISVFSGSERVSELCQNFAHADREAAKAWYRELRLLALMWIPSWSIIDQMSILRAAADALIPDTIEEIA